ncbi:hypothetical protein BFW01_g1619 [Lasiodiplodia theobromae]|nr:hypothetical protein BFW01_g1619 [Lasiodiplodia theobromae]
MSEVTVVFVSESCVWKVLVARLNDVLLIALNAVPNLLFPATTDPKRHLVNEVDDGDAASHSQHMVSSSAESGGLIRGYQHDVVGERGDESHQVDQSVVAFDRASSATSTRPSFEATAGHRSPRQRVRKIIGRAEAAFATDSGPVSEREVIRGPYHANQVPFGIMVRHGSTPRCRKSSRSISLSSRWSSLLEAPWLVAVPNSCGKRPRRARIERVLPGHWQRH